MAAVQDERVRIENLVERVKYSRRSRAESYMPSSLHLPIRQTPSRSTTPPQTPGLSTGASSPPSQFPSSSPFSELREERIKNADVFWEFPQSQDSYDAPPLTATASEFSEVDDNSFDFSRNIFPLHYEEAEDDLTRKAKYREPSDVLIAAEALIMFSHCPMEKAAGPSRIPLPNLDHHISPSTGSTPPSPTLLGIEAIKAGLDRDKEESPSDDDLSVRLEDQQVPPCRSPTPTSPRPQFKRILSNKSSGSISTPSSPKRPRKKCRSSGTECSVSTTNVSQDGIDLDTERTSLISLEDSPHGATVIEPPEPPNAHNGSPLIVQDGNHAQQSNLQTSTESQHASSCLMDKAELQGHIISILALSRSSSLTSSAIVRQLLSNQPGILVQRSKADWVKAVNAILDADDPDKPIFSRIERLGKDAAARNLENQYFYNPENDPDQERADILGEMVPKKRGVTKQHRQYYYAPVGKHTTKWDHEVVP